MARANKGSSALSSSTKSLPQQAQCASSNNIHDDAKVAASTYEISQVNDTTIQEINKSSTQNAAFTKREDVGYSTGQNEQTLGASTPLKKEESKDEQAPNNSFILKSEAPGIVKSETQGIKNENESVKVENDLNQNSIITIDQYQIILTGLVSNIEVRLTKRNQNQEEKNVKIKCERSNGTQIPYQIMYEENIAEGNKETLSESNEKDQDIHDDSDTGSASVSNFSECVWISITLTFFLLIIMMPRKKIIQTIGRRQKGEHLSESRQAQEENLSDIENPDNEVSKSLDEEGREHTNLVSVCVCMNCIIMTLNQNLIFMINWYQYTLINS